MRVPYGTDGVRHFSEKNYFSVFSGHNVTSEGNRFYFYLIFVIQTSTMTFAIALMKEIYVLP